MDFYYLFFNCLEGHRTCVEDEFQTGHHKE
jgi:hypothetical protein